MNCGHPERFLLTTRVACQLNNSVQPWLTFQRIWNKETTMRCGWPLCLNAGRNVQWLIELGTLSSGVFKLLFKFLCWSPICILSFDVQQNVRSECGHCGSQSVCRPVGQPVWWCGRKRLFCPAPLAKALHVQSVIALQEDHIYALRSTSETLLDSSRQWDVSAFASKRGRFVHALKLQRWVSGSV